MAQQLNGSQAIKEALTRPYGARFFKVALQVNPYDYVVDNKKPDHWGSEAAYNDAIVAVCKSNGISAIGVTDHHRVSASSSLINAASAAGVAVFPGFEAETKEGVHFLCLFEPGTSVSLIERYLGDCGIYKPASLEPCKYDISELLDRVESWNAVAIAAHVVASKGILATLKGSARANAWKNPKLVAVALPGPAVAVQEQYRAILQNVEPSYQRDRPLAVVNCNDVSSPDDLSLPSTSTFIKMSVISIEGLRQAFLDPESRIRLNTDEPEQERTELIAMSWEGGFLDGLRIRFNRDLNVFIGGRGTGKSTIIESIRYIIGGRALGANAQDAHEKLIRNVVGNGTKITLAVESHRPAKRRYIIERTVPNAPIVRDTDGKIVSVSPLRLLPGIEIFGQHEITEVTRSPGALTDLLARFADADPSLVVERATLLNKLDESRIAILKAERDLRALVERLASLPALQETQKQYKDAGVEDRLRDQSLIVREEQTFRAFDERLQRVGELIQSIDEVTPVDAAFVSDAALKDLPGRIHLAKLRTLLADLDVALQRARKLISEALAAARDGEVGVFTVWSVRKAQVQEQYEKILRDLHKSKIDGEDFIRLRRQIEELTPLISTEQKLRELSRRLATERAALIADWDELLRREYRRLDLAAKRVSMKLGDRLRITVNFMNNHEPLYAHLRKVKFRDPETPKPRGNEPFSLRTFAAALSAGVDELVKKYRYTQAQAERLVQAGPQWRMQLEEIDLPATTEIQLNVGTQGRSEWRSLSDLSTGQKATAVLLLLLIESDAPLIVDQPEDDLDNRFISESVVPKIRDAKGRRQFIFATHNANIPVLGDAELIAGLTAVGEAETSGQAHLPEDLVGSIDSPPVAMFAEEILEGGKVAFVMRKQKYGF